MQKTSTSIRPLRLIVVGAIALAGLVAVGCNTVEGAGKDVQSAGKGIENVAEKTGDAMSGKK